MESTDRGRVELQLEHVSCLVGENLIKVHSELNTGDEQRLLPINVSANNNIFCSVSSSSMVSMTGNSDMEEFKGMLTWNGNRNWYERIGSLWQVDSTYDDAVEDYDFEGWREHWRDKSDSSENGAVFGEAVFQAQSKTKPVSELRLTDLALDETSEAIGTDGKNVGADWRRLPPNAIPPEDE